MTETTIRQKLADEILRQKASKSAIDAIMYLRILVGREFDDTFHQIARKLHKKP